MNLIELRSFKASLADDVERVYAHAKNLGATKGIQGLAVVGKHFKKLTIEEAYMMLNLEGIQQEVEEVQERKYKLGIWRVLRNSFSLLPLILTWFALYQATSNYQQDLANPKYRNLDQYQPFLRLWQEGFHGMTWFTFSRAALIDVWLLLSYLFLILLVAFLERRAYDTSNSFAQKLQGVSDELIDAIAIVGPSAGTSDTGIDRIVETIEKVADAGTDKLLQAVKSVSDADIEKIVQAIKQVLDDALISSDQVAQKAQEFIEKSNEKMEDVFNTKIKTMLDQFHTDLGTLNTDLKRLGGDLRKLGADLLSYDKQLKDLTDASSKLANNAGDLTTSTKTYVSVGQEIRDQITSLNTTQQQMVTEISNTQKDVVQQIGVAAGSMNTVAQETSLVAKDLGQITKKDIQTMTKYVADAADHVTDAAEALTQVKSTLSQANQQLYGSVSQVNQHLQNSLIQVSQQLQFTTQELQNAAQSLANATGRRRKQQKPQAQAQNQVSNTPPPRPLWKKILRIQ